MVSVYQVVLLVAMLSVSVWATPDFMIGKQGVTPPSGMRLASLYDLQISLTSSFVQQYNSMGLPVQANTITSNCCIYMAENAWLYVPSYNYLYPCVNGSTICSVDIAGSMRFGINYLCYQSLNEADVRSWTTSPGCANPSYALWVRDVDLASNTPTLSPSSTYSPYHPYSASASPMATSPATRTAVSSSSRTRAPTQTPYYPYTPTRTATPQRTPAPPSQYLCCLYFSPSEHYETALCQQTGYTCPFVQNFSPVGNYTISSCNDCSIYY